jgi:hypothetical protein
MSTKKTWHILCNCPALFYIAMSNTEQVRETSRQPCLISEKTVSRRNLFRLCVSVAASSQGLGSMQCEFNF